MKAAGNEERDVLRRGDSVCTKALALKFSDREALTIKYIKAGLPVMKDLFDFRARL